MRHHWVHRRRQEGKCKQCCKVGHCTTLHHMQAPHAASTTRKCHSWYHSQHHSRAFLAIPSTIHSTTCRHLSLAALLISTTHGATCKHHTYYLLQAPHVAPPTSTTHYAMSHHSQWALHPITAVYLSFSLVLCLHSVLSKWQSWLDIPLTGDETDSDIQRRWFPPRPSNSPTSLAQSDSIPSHSTLVLQCLFWPQQLYAFLGDWTPKSRRCTNSTVESLVCLHVASSMLIIAVP